MCVALVGTIESIEGDGVQSSGLVRLGSSLRLINLAFVPEARVGDRVVVHSGLAVRVRHDKDGETVEVAATDRT